MRPSSLLALALLLPLVAGAEVAVEITVTRDTTLEWIWTPQHRVVPAIEGQGAIQVATNACVEPDGSAYWVDQGTNLTATAMPDAYSSFQHWQGFGTDNPLSLAITEPLTLTAVFADLATARGTPHRWLAERGFDPAEGDARVVNQYTLADHYRLDTDPNDSQGYFATGLAPGEIVLRNTSTNVAYGARVAATLAPADWQPYTNAVPGQPGETRIPLSPGDAPRFYRGHGHRR